MVDDALKLRIDADDDRAAASQEAAAGATGAACRVGTTKAVATYPTTAGACYAMKSTTILGAEVEGGAGAATAAGDTWYAFNLGSAVPPIGTAVVCTATKYRWVFRYD